MASDLVQQLYANWNTQFATGALGPQQQQIDMDAAVQWLIEQNPPEQMHEWFRDEQMFARGWKKPDGTNYDIPVADYWDEIVEMKKDEYTKAVIDEAWKSEWNLFPGMIALVGEALTYPVRHPVKTAKFVNEKLNQNVAAQFSAIRHPIRTAKAAGEMFMDAAAARSMVWGPWGGRQEQHPPKEIIAAPPYEPPTGPVDAKGEESLPWSYRRMKPYFDSYERLIEVEAEYMNALNKQRGVDEIKAFGPGLSMAIGSTAANAGTAVINPVGRVAKMLALGTGLTVKGGTIMLGALAASGNMGKVFRGVGKGGSWAKSKLGQSLNLLAHGGRGAHPAVDGIALAEGISKAEIRAAGILKTDPGVPHVPSLDEIINNVYLEVGQAETRRLNAISARRVARSKGVVAATGGLPQAAFTPAPFKGTKLPYVTDAQMAKLRGAAAADAAVQNAGLGHLVPQKATALWKTAREMVLNEDIGRHIAEPALEAQARQATWELKEFARLSGQKNVLSPIIQESERMVKAIKKDPNKKNWWVPRFLEPVWKMSGNAAESYRIAGSYLNNNQTYLQEVGVQYHRMKEALPDTAIRQDMIPFLEETGNAWKGADDTYADVVQRLQDGDYYEQAVWWKDYLRQRFDNLFNEMNELNAEIGGDLYEYQKNWLHHMWDEPVKTAEAKLAKIPHYELPVKHGSERPRFFDSYYKGMTEAGLTPRTDDIAVMYGLMEQQLGRVLATKKMVKELNEFGLVTKSMDKPAFLRLGAWQSVPDGYTTFRSSFTDRILQDSVPEGVRKNTTVYIHDDVAKHLRNIIEQPMELDGLTKLSAVAKRSNFMFTLFHMYSLAESSVALLGTNPIKGMGMRGGAMRVNWNLARNSVLRKGSRWADGEALAHLVTPETYKEAFTRASEAGVKLGAPMNDIMADQFSTAINQWAAKTPTASGKRISKKFAKKLLDFQEMFDTTIWSKYHTPMKVIAYDIMLDNLMTMRNTGKAGMGRMLPKNLRWMKKGLETMDDEALSRSVASYINDEFGSQAFELHTRGFIENIISRPKNLRILNALFTSVDWNASAIRASLSFAQAVPGLRSYNPARGIMGIRHWRNAAMGWMFYANIMNKALSGHYMWENEPGKKIFYIDMGQRDEKGAPLYTHIGKQFRELGTAVGGQPGLMAGGPTGARPGYHGVKPYVHTDGAFIGSFVGKKLMPWIQVPASTIMDYSIMKARMLREGKEMGWTDGFTIAVNNAVSGFTPFSVGAFRNPALRDASFDQKLVLGLVGTALPLSKGLNRSKLTAMAAEALREGDYQRYNQIILDLVQSRGSQFAGEIALNAKEAAQLNPSVGLEVDPLEGLEAVNPPPQNPLQRLRQLLKP